MMEQFWVYMWSNRRVCIVFVYIVCAKFEYNPSNFVVVVVGAFFFAFSYRVNTITVGGGRWAVGGFHIKS